MTDMKPCPFCGGTDLHLESFSGWGNDVIVCYECLAVFSQQEITCEEDLIRAWNKRANDYYDAPILVEQIELDCEPHQAMRSMFCFNVADDTKLDVVAKMSEEGGVYIARAYVNSTDTINIPKEVVAQCLNKAKAEIVTQFESNAGKERK